MSDPSKKGASIPAWQQNHVQTTEPRSREEPLTETADTTTTDPRPTHTELLEQAKEFLQQDDIKDAPREQKIQFLKEKGLQLEDIDKLLPPDTGQDEQLKTVHDTSQTETKTGSNAKEERTPAIQAATFMEDRRPDVPPIITYPEFLLKPEKPPPLITVSRLVNAAYVLAGVSALTWGASKYIVQPMLQTLTEARHDLAAETLQDLEKMNTKLEATVSHVPYIASLAAQRKQNEEEDETESVDSDPTELFHRDIATQTSPGLSRSSSEDSLSGHKSTDATENQASRLSSLHAQLATLVQSTEYTSNKDEDLNKTLKDFQTLIDNLDSSYSVLKNDWGTSSIYSSALSDAKKATAKNSEAEKFKTEIRSLKGAFLSSRNFPTAPRATTAGYGAR